MNRISSLIIICLILPLQLTFGDHLQFQYQQYQQRTYRVPLIRSNVSPQLTSRINAMPAVAQALPSQNVRMAGLQISRGAEQFSFEMFHAIADAVQNFDTVNFVISPFSVYSLMLLLAEGAAGKSFQQMEQTLHLPGDLTYLRTAYKAFQKALVVNTTTVELAVNQAIFSDLNRPIDNSYASILSNDYEADHIAVNFNDRKQAVQAINQHISSRTNGKIQNVIKSEDLTDAQLLLASTIFFRGQWKYPFNASLTTEQAFYSEKGDYVSHVPMMYQRGIFPFAAIADLEANVVELPYGKEDRLCMLLLLPRRNSTLTTVFDKLKSYNIARITHELHKFDHAEDFEEAEIELTLPRFKIDSDLELRTVLEHLGITDIFDPVKSNLSKLSRQPTFVSRVFHKAIIEVNEEGTVAAAISGGTVSFKQTPIEFVANRPFGFLITERQTNTLLFAGQIRHPLK